MTSTTPVFTRPISATERLYLATAPLAEPFAIQLVVEGAGDIDVDALRRAVELASHACPGARLVRRGKNWVDSGLAPHLDIVEHGGVDFTALDANPILTRPLGVTADATTEVVLVTSDPTTVKPGDDAWHTRLEQFMQAIKRDGRLLAAARKHKLDPIVVLD